MFFLGMAGCNRVKFTGVRFNLSNAKRCFRIASRTWRQTIRSVTIKPAISDVVLREFARSRRREAEFPSVGEFQSCWLALRRNEIRTFQKLNGCFEPRSRAVIAPFHQGAEPPAPHDLDSRPVQ